MFSEKIQELTITNLGISGVILLILSVVIFFLIVKIKNIYAKLFIFLITLIFAYFVIVNKDNDLTEKKENIISNHTDCCYVTNIKTDLSVRLESTASNDENVIDKLYLNTKNITVIHVKRNAHGNIWYEIEYTKNLLKRTGWVFGKYLTSTYGKYHLKKEYGGAKIRNNFSTNALRKGFLKEGEKNIIVIDKKRNQETSKTWFKILHVDDSNSEIEGWVSGKLLEIDAD